MISIDTIVFTSAVFLLVIVEITLIYSVIMLTRNIRKLNENTQKYFGELMLKVKGLVDLFIIVQSKKLSNQEEKEEHK